MLNNHRHREIGNDYKPVFFLEVTLCELCDPTCYCVVTTFKAETMKADFQLLDIAFSIFVWMENYRKKFKTKKRNKLKKCRIII